MPAVLPHIPALDGLRGVAVVLILLFHADHLRGGWLGVDLFFVLSGFLITSLLFAEWDSTGRISLASFWGRRARRLLPALLLLLFGVSAYAACFAAPEELARIRADGIATLLYVANWHAVVADYDYWAIFSAPSPLDHTWSLAIEEQFYLFWPPIVWLGLARLGLERRELGGVALGMALASAAWMAWLYAPESGTARVYFGTDTRMAATLIGAALAAALATRLREGSPAGDDPRGDPLAFAGLGALLAASFSLDGDESFVYRGGLFVLILAAAACLAGLVLAPRGWMARGLSSGIWRWLGKLSYGAYLWHWPLYLVLTPERVGLDGLALTAVRIGATLWVAWASFEFVEWPIRSGRVAPRRLAVFAGLATALLLPVGLLSTQVPEDFARGGEAVAPVADDAPLDVLLVGDSLAYILTPAFVEEAQARGLNAQALGVEACGSLRATGLRYLSGHVFDLSRCLSIRDRWLAAAHRRAPRDVVLFEGWTGEGWKQLDGDWIAPCSEAYDAAYGRDLTGFVEALLETAERVHVLSVPPPAIEDLPSRFSKLWGGMPRAELDARFRERVACQNRVRRDVAAATPARLLDLEAALCGADGVCQRLHGDVLLRPDGMHFEGPGARWAANWLLDRVAEAP